MLYFLCAKDTNDIVFLCAKDTSDTVFLCVIKRYNYSVFLCRFYV